MTMLRGVSYSAIVPGREEIVDEDYDIWIELEKSTHSKLTCSVLSWLIARPRRVITRKPLLWSHSVMGFRTNGGTHDVAGS